MILHNEKIIFVHIPKTGGQSITKFLLENVNVKFNLKNEKHGLIINNKNKLQGPNHYHHCKLTEYQTLNLANNISLFFKFCVFRNPYTRFASAFYYNQTTHKCETYKRFVQYIETKKISNNSVLFRHTIPQTWYIDYNLKLLNKYFFTENLKELEYFFNKSFNFYKPLSTENVSNLSKAPIDGYTKDFIDKYYVRDFDLLGYKNETP